MSGNLVPWFIGGVLFGMVAGFAAVAAGALDWIDDLLDGRRP